MVRSESIFDEASKGKTYELARTPEEAFINDYSPALLSAWKGNVDVQYVGECKKITHYVTSYTTKGEIAKKHEDDGVVGSMTRPQAIPRMGYDEINSREVAALDMIDDLLGHSNFRFDQADVWIPTDEHDSRQRILNPKNSQQSGTYKPNLIDVYYPRRPSSLERFSLYNIAINFSAKCKGSGNREESEGEDSEEEESGEGDDEAVEDVTSHESADDRSSPFYRHHQSDLYVQGMNKRFNLVKQKIARFYIPEHDDNSPSSSEDFYRRMCLLFIPWRDESSILNMYGQLMDATTPGGREDLDAGSDD